MAKDELIATSGTCPRCNQPVVEVRDWGEAGRLYIHFYFEEGGLVHKDAHHIHVGEIEHGLNWTFDSEGISAATER